MGFQIFITLLLVFMNSFFVAAEFAIVKIRASQLEVKAQAGNRIAILAKHIISHLDGYLAATQLGITLASLGLGWVGEPVVSEMIENLLGFTGIHIEPETAKNIALPVAFILITILHIVFGELAPKSIAIQRSEKTTMVLAYPLHFFYLLFRPFIWMLNGIANSILKLLGIPISNETEIHSSEELKYLFEQGKDSGVIETADYNIIKNAFDFSERTARQVLIPRIQIVAIDADKFNDTVLEEILEEGFSRIPVYENTLDNVLGVVYMKDILLHMRKNMPINIREMMRPVLMIPETKGIGQLLKDFQLKHQQIAVVINEYGGTTGIITMEDILEELVGEIQDEYDDETPIVEKMNDKIYNIVAQAFIDDINKLLPRSIKKDEQYETLAGLLTLRFGRIPNTNDKIIVDEFEYTILKKSKSSIALVQLRDLQVEKEPEVTGSEA